MPERIQLSRRKGWRKPDGAISVARPSKWGNHYAVRRSRVIVDGEVKYAGPWTVVALRRGRETGSMWGSYADKADAVALSVLLFGESLAAVFSDLDGEHSAAYYLGPLRGHDLACWCPLDQPCHADVLLDLANRPAPSDRGDER